MTERTYTATQDSPPSGPWRIRLQQGDHVMEDTCDDDHKAGAREEMDRRMDARIAMDCE
jgi:hypothetical protein